MWFTDIGVVLYLFSKHSWYMLMFQTFQGFRGKCILNSSAYFRLLLYFSSKVFESCENTRIYEKKTIDTIREQTGHDYIDYSHISS